MKKFKKSKLFILSKKNWAACLIVAYIIVFVFYTYLFCKSSGENVLLSSDQFGTFLSGFFAPIAFLFLIKGYLQQNKNLELLTYQVEQLQADRKVRTYQSRAIFEFSNGKILERLNEPDFEGYVLQFLVKNLGKPATDVKFVKAVDNEFINGNLFKSNILSEKIPAYELVDKTSLLIQLKFESIPVKKFIGLDEEDTENEVIFYIRYCNELGEYINQKLRINTFIDQNSNFSQFIPKIYFN